MKTPIQLFLAVLAFLCVLIPGPRSPAVVPPPDGGYPGGNTAEGRNALLSLTTGGFNTAVGYLSLRTNATGSFNTAIGTGTLLANTAEQNTAIGAGALLSNTTGDRNTANGTFALFNNTTGNSNTAEGWRVLFQNITGDRNAASGRAALTSNTTGFENTATGAVALENNTTGNDNTATGFAALNGNTTGALNTANGTGALANSTGNLNVASGFGAGAYLVTGNNNIDIANVGVAVEANVIRIGTEVAIMDPFGVIHPAHTATYIAGIRGKTTGMADAMPVLIDSAGQLGTMSSSARFKKEIKPMDKASESVLALKPVRFQYKSDTNGIPQFGLIAEEVAEVNPDLVVRNKNGEIYTVRYDAVNAMLLNEFLKEHRKVEKLEAALEAVNARLKEQDAKIERVSGRIQIETSAARTVASRQ
jgi:hypothetical protein